MPRRANYQLLMKLKEILEDPSVPASEKTNAKLAKLLGVSERTIIRWKAKLSKLDSIIGRGDKIHHENNVTLTKSILSPSSTSTGTAKRRPTKPPVSHGEKARRKLLSATHDKCKVPVESEVGQEGLGGSCFLLDSLFVGLRDPLVHGVLLDCGVVDGSFGRARGFGYDFEFKGNLSNLFRVFKFGDGRYFRVSVFMNGRVRVDVNCSCNPLDVDGLIDLFNLVCQELYRLNGFKFYDPNNIVLKRIEFNVDGGSVEYVFDKSPAQVITFKTFTGAFIRYYKSKKRFEVGGPANEALKLKETLCMISGGVSFYLLQQILAQFMQNMKYIESLRREVEVLRTQIDDLAGRLKMNNYNIVLPKTAQTQVFQSKLIVETRVGGSSQTYNEVTRQLPARSDVCPFLREGGCTANLSGYASYVSKRIREEYCLSGRHQECWQYQYYVKHYGG